MSSTPTCMVDKLAQQTCDTIPSLAIQWADDDLTVDELDIFAAVARKFPRLRALCLSNRLKGTNLESLASTFRTTLQCLQVHVPPRNGANNGGGAHHDDEYDRSWSEAQFVYAIGEFVALKEAHVVDELVRVDRHIFEPESEQLANALASDYGLIMRTYGSRTSGPLVRLYFSSWDAGRNLLTVLRSVEL